MRYIDSKLETIKPIQSNLIKNANEKFFVMEKLEAYIEYLKEMVIEMEINDDNPEDIKHVDKNIHTVTCILYGIKYNTIDLDNPSWNAKHWIRKAKNL